MKSTKPLEHGTLIFLVFDSLAVEHLEVERLEVEVES